MPRRRTGIFSGRGSTRRMPAAKRWKNIGVKSSSSSSRSGVFGKLKLADARKAIRNYRRATGNVAGTIDLLLTYVENGTEFTQQFGDINEAFYHSLESALNELAALLCGEGREFYPQCRERLARVEQLANHIGWGYGDYVREQVAMLTCPQRLKKRSSWRLPVCSSSTLSVTPSW